MTIAVLPGVHGIDAPQIDFLRACQGRVCVCHARARLIATEWQGAVWQRNRFHVSCICGVQAGILAGTRLFFALLLLRDSTDCEGSIEELQI
jgi:hypothetical protein